MPMPATLSDPALITLVANTPQKILSAGGVRSGWGAYGDPGSYNIRFWVQLPGTGTPTDAQMRSTGNKVVQKMTTDRNAVGTTHPYPYEVWANLDGGSGTTIRVWETYN